MTFGTTTPPVVVMPITCAEEGHIWCDECGFKRQMRQLDCPQCAHLAVLAAEQCLEEEKVRQEETKLAVPVNGTPVAKKRGRKKKEESVLFPEISAKERKERLEKLDRLA